MLKIGVLVSGGGTNLQALIDGIKSGYLDKCVITVVISSKPGVFAIERAKSAGIPAVCIARRDYATLDEYDIAIIKCMKGHEADLIVMAGFLSILGSRFISEYEGKVINIHPALIPSFCGKGFYGIVPHQKALEYGVKITGATVHFVELDTDSGPIILQKAVAVEDDDTPEILQKRVMEQGEHIILPEAVKLFSEGRLKVEGRRVRIL